MQSKRQARSLAPRLATAGKAKVCKTRISTQRPTDEAQLLLSLLFVVDRRLQTNTQDQSFRAVVIIEKKTKGTIDFSDRHYSHSSSICKTGATLVLITETTTKKQKTKFQLLFCSFSCPI